MQDREFEMTTLLMTSRERLLIDLILNHCLDDALEVSAILRLTLSSNLRPIYA